LIYLNVPCGLLDLVAQYSVEPGSGMTFQRLSLAMSAVCIGGHLFSVPAYAADLTGVWASTASACDKIFVKKGGKVSIAKDADLYGSGLIIEQNRIRGKIVTCNITARRDDGSVTHFVAQCSTDIALETVQFSFELDDKNKITRLYPGIPELKTPYYRWCL
jgi:hypothetical protein